MKTTRHRIYTLGFALALAASSLHATTNKLPAPKPEFLNSEQLAEWRAKKTAEFEAKKAQESAATSQAEHFYTGKPYIEETGQYAFLFRSYDPGLSRWTTSDPSGFPDGTNNVTYCPVPTSEFDWQGLAKMSAAEGIDHFLDGQGEGVTENFNDYYPDVNFTENDFGQFYSLFSSISSGTLNTLRDPAHNFGSVTAAGRVTFRLQGTVTSNQNSKTFSGAITIDGEWYNFDSRPWGERSLPAELITRFADFALGDLLGGDEFWVNFEGSHPITYTEYE